LGFKFDNILMEEAAQILEIETFIPMVLQNQDPEAPPRLKRVLSFFLLLPSPSFLPPSSSLLPPPSSLLPPPSSLLLPPNSLQASSSSEIITSSLPLSRT
jgi:hypothetical protein